MRLIDADALLAEAMVDGAYGYVDAKQIANAPTIDAVPVVRCGDCVHFSSSWGETYCLISLANTDEDCYCVDGEREYDV